MKFDKECLEQSTAIKAIWLLWRRARWTALNELGLSRELIDEPFTAFDLHYIKHERGALRDTKLFVAILPDEVRQAVLSAAIVLNMTYAQLGGKQDVYVPSHHE